MRRKKDSIALTGAERARNCRQKKKENSHEEYKEAERKRWADRKREGKTPTVKLMTTQEHRAKKKQWRIATYEKRKREKLVNLNTLPQSPMDNNTNVIHLNVDQKWNSGRKRVLRKRSKTNRDLQKCRVELEQFDQLLIRNKTREAKARSKLSRLRKKLQKDFISRSVARKYRMSKWTKQHIHYDVRSSKQSQKRGRKPLLEVVKRKITDFYLSDENSSTTARKKQTVSRADEKMQKRFLTDNLVKLHERYQKSTHFKVSYKTFVSLKPFWVLRPDVTRRKTCLCKRCINLGFMACTLHKHGIIKTKDLKVLSKLVICRRENNTVPENCAVKQCGICNKSPINHNANFEDNTSWQTWDTKKIDLSTRLDETGKTKIARVMDKTTKYGTVQELAETFDTEFTNLGGAKHITMYMHQQAMYLDLKSKLRQGQLLILCDFAENWSCKFTEEPQAMHFGASRDSVTIHGGVVYSAIGVKSFATLSNCPRHDVRAIWTYLRPVLAWLFQEYPDTSELFFWTDGLSSQYKSKNNFYLMSTLIADWYPHVKTVVWNYSGAGHGKSAAKGVGALIKRSADSIVACGQDISCVTELFQKLSDRGLRTKLFYASAKEVDQECKLPPNLSVVKGATSLHQVGVVEKGKIWYRGHSCFCSFPAICHCYNQLTHSFLEIKSKSNQEQAPLEQPTIEEPLGSGISVKAAQEDIEPEVALSQDLVGSWVVVVYDQDDRPYPGEVVSYDPIEHVVNVKVMRHKGNNAFNWPLHKDVVAYTKDCVKCSISAPVLHKRHYKLNLRDWIAYQEYL